MSPRDCMILTTVLESVILAIIKEEEELDVREAMFWSIGFDLLHITHIIL